MAKLQYLSINTNIQAPVITDAMRIALLLTIAKQLGVTINEQANLEVRRDSNVAVASR